MLVGETLNQFVGRLRIERAATLLIQHSERLITGITVQCGLTNPASFARPFEEASGMSATEWRASGFLRYERSRERPSGTSSAAWVW